MDKNKKDEKNKKRREAYHRNKTASSVHSQEAQPEATAGVLTQLQNTPISKDVASEKENVDPVEDNEWLRRNDTYQRRPIQTSCEEQKKLPTDVDVNICSSDEPTTDILQEEPTTSILQRQPTTPILQQKPTDSKERIRQQERERYAQMDVHKKDELLERRRQRDRERYAQVDVHKKDEVLERKRQHEKERYAKMTPEQKHTKKARRKGKRNSLNLESIAMENPLFIPELVWDNVYASGPRRSIPTSEWTVPEFSDTPVYIQSASEQTTDVDTTAVDSGEISRRKHVTHGERHALMCRRNESFQASGTKNEIDTIDELLTMDTETINGNGSASPTPENAQIQQAPPQGNGDGVDEGVILEDDSDDEDYIFAGQEDTNDDVEMYEASDDSASISSEPDPYDAVYSTIPKKTHVLKPVASCKHCHAKKFEREPPGFCCRGGKTKLANQDTPPDLVRLWTSSDPDARHFLDNIRFFNGHF